MSDANALPAIELSYAPAAEQARLRLTLTIVSVLPIPVLVEDLVQWGTYFAQLILNKSAAMPVSFQLAVPLTATVVRVIVAICLIIVSRRDRRRGDSLTTAWFCLAFAVTVLTTTLVVMAWQLFTYRSSFGGWPMIFTYTVQATFITIGKALPPTVAFVLLRRAGTM